MTNAVTSPKPKAMGAICLARAAGPGVIKYIASSLTWAVTACDEEPNVMRARSSAQHPAIATIMSAKAAVRNCGRIQITTAMKAGLISTASFLIAIAAANETAD